MIVEYRGIGRNAERRICALDVKQSVEQEIARLTHLLRERQLPDGSWRFCFESGPMTDAYMIITLRTLNMDDERLIRQLAERIAAKQEKDGSWKLYYDEQAGNVAATVDAYYALLSSGFYSKKEQRMQNAKRFILSAGGLDKVGTLTKAILALTGQIPWPWHFKFPVEILLLPPSFPLNFFDFSTYARVHLTPIFIAADRNFSIRAKGMPNLSDLVVQHAQENLEVQRARDDMRSLIRPIKRWIATLPHLPQHLHSFALKRAEQYMLDRTEKDGTLYSYASATFLMVYALLALRYPKNHPLIKRAIDGLKTLTCRTDGHLHLENSTATVWNTALLSHSLQTAGVPASDPMIQKSGKYLLSRQHRHYGDWTVHNPNVVPGGWGFSDINTINPDNDDTSAALRAIHQLSKTDSTYHDAWERGLNWILSMQNADGGWAAFEKNTDNVLLPLLPIDGAEAAATDPSTADLTGRTLEFLGSQAGLSVKHRIIKRAVDWLFSHTESDGSWYGRWGVSYIYGTWAALTGLMAVGISPENRVVQQAVKWLASTQNIDGGWGESCISDVEKRYVPLGASTPSQTAWALDALIAVHEKPTPVIDRGVHYLIESGQKTDWTVRYPTGAALPGQFYIHYHGYRYIWPLLTLGNYRRKYMK